MEAETGARGGRSAWLGRRHHCCHGAEAGAPCNPVAVQVWGPEELYSFLWHQRPLWAPRLCTPLPSPQCPYARSAGPPACRAQLQPGPLKLRGPRAAHHMVGSGQAGPTPVLLCHLPVLCTVGALWAPDLREEEGLTSTWLADATAYFRIKPRYTQVQMWHCARL